MAIEWQLIFAYKMKQMENRITKLLNIKYPIIQAGMIWCSGWRLASAAANAGAFGIIGAGSMYPDVLKEHIQKCKQATSGSWGVNVPLLYPDIEHLMKIIVESGVEVVFTSAGNPATWTPYLKENGIKVIHVVSNKKFALKAQSAGVDAVVAEGFEAGGHNGREETTTLCLIPEIVDALDIPVIAAGGIGDGRAMLAVMALGAEGVQVGSRFAASVESSAHEAFKSAIVEAQAGSTKLMMKDIVPVRLLKNKFYEEVEELEQNCAPKEERVAHLGRGRAKKGMFEGNLDEGELEIGQVSANIQKIESASDIINEFVKEYNHGLTKLSGATL
jgi:enoyl-[acyl-carrier protein] reductase II